MSTRHETPYGPVQYAEGQYRITMDEQITDAGVNYRFDHWQDTGNTDHQRDFLLTVDRELNAVYVQLLEEGATPWGPTAHDSKTYNITLTQTSVVVGGVNYSFDHWNIAKSGQNPTQSTSNPLPLTLDANTTLTIVFLAEAVPTLTITVNNSAGGTAVATEQPPYTLNQTVHVTATANVPNYQFDGWLLDAEPHPASENPIAVLMSADRALQALFSSVTQPSLTITVNDSNRGDTSVDVQPPYSQGQTVNVTATPASTSWKFDGWIKDGNPTLILDNPIAILMDTNHTLMAQFSSTTPTPLPYLALALLGVVAVGGVFLLGGKRGR